jgi:la-related protein 1
MVSPTSTTSQTPALSYAESAKKAQGVKLASQVAQKPLSNPPRQPPAPVLDPKKAGLTSPTLETSLTSLADLSLHDGPSSGANPSAPTSPSGSTSHSSTATPIDSVPTGIVSSSSAKPAPKPNVWNQRIQQRAQTRPPPRPPQSLPHMTQSHVLRVPSPTRDPPSTSSGSRQPDVPVSSIVQIPASPSVLNGASGASSTSSPSTGTTPSSRREPLPHPPPVDDAETWPEVGKSQTSAGKSQRVSNGYTGPVEVKDVEEKDADGLSPSHPGTPRKSASFLRVHLSKPIFFST